jgi:mycocyclosin synthase
VSAGSGVAEEPPRFPFSCQGESLAEQYRTLQGACPVTRVRTNTGDLAWLVTGYAVARQVLGDERFDHGLTVDPGVPRQDTLAQSQSSITAQKRLVEVGLYAELMRCISPPQCAALRPQVRGTANRLLDDLLASGAPADLQAGYFRALPISVACEQFGFPLADRERFEQWERRALSLSTHTPQELQDSWREFCDYTVDLMESLDSAADGTVLGRLLAVNRQIDPARRMSVAELADALGSLFIASYTSTSSVLSVGTVALLRQPAAWSRLCRPPGVNETALEELLRYALWIHDALPRIATEDVELGGVLVRAGDLVLMPVDAANRDPGVFTDPDVLDLDRTPNPHLSFGHGHNYCPGTSMARTVVTEAFSVLVQRLPGLRLAPRSEPITWRPAEELRMPDELWVEW